MQGRRRSLVGDTRPQVDVGLLTLVDDPCGLLNKCEVLVASTVVQKNIQHYVAQFFIGVLFRITHCSA
jgi:hypothetical protein